MSVNTLIGRMSVAHLQGTDICYEPVINQIPVIDFGLLKQKTTLSARPVIIEDIKNACQKLGCFHVYIFFLLFLQHYHQPYLILGVTYVL